jgi:MurNAc alpha-1-phosphate uridylyltransferase
VLVDNPDHHPGGDYGLGPGGRATAGPARLTFSGISMLDPALFAGCGPGFLPLKPLLDRALAAGRLTGQRHGGAWRDVGTPARLAALDAELRLGKARHPVLSSPVG